MQDQAPLKKEFTKNDALILRTGKAAETFLESEFGKYFMGLLKSALEEKRLEYERPVEVLMGVDGVAQVLRAESAKGAIMGIRLALSIPAGMVSEMKALKQAKGLGGTAGEDE